MVHNIHELLKVRYDVTMTGDADEIRRFVERFAAVLGDGGMRRMPARVFARVLVEDDGQLTAGEIAERLDVSPAAVSGAVRYLLQVGMLRRTREPGERRDHYRVHDDVWPEMYTHQAALLRRWVETADDGAALLGPDSPAGRRLAATRDFFAFMQEELPELLKRWQERSS
jgi:DNA-binding transcriptional regulator GbsR (MarR family)